ncbi:hypothetical protein K438DRAFT_1853434, partial [Mycena galopus ATCC 62051]
PNGWFVHGPDARPLPPRGLEPHGRPHPMRDVMTGSVPGEPAPFTPSPQRPIPPPASR